jgi:hypothetical protein
MRSIYRYKTHGEHHNSVISGLTNGKKRKLKKKKSNSTTPNKHITTRRRNGKNSEQIEEEDDETSDDDDESEPMDFERAFGSVTDVLKIEHKDMHENNGIIDGLNISAGDSYFDFSNKIDLKTYTQPVLVSSTINLNPLAAVSFFINKNFL